MEHRTVQSENFNYLTIEHTKDGIILTGETKEGLDKDDTIQNPYKANEFLPIKKILERRDSRDYPKVNNYFYKILL
jgi:hypothetical protein